MTMTTGWRESRRAAWRWTRRTSRWNILDDFEREWVKDAADEDSAGAPWLSAAMREQMDKDESGALTCSATTSSCKTCSTAPPIPSRSWLAISKTG